MGVTWTEDQKKVIDLRNRNILVSAAAGSGKTAVLVERIMELVCDETHPVDVDRLLVVTFTKAAAAEMKERVGAAIRKRLEEQPNNGYLQRQETLVSHAQITTIDSFCSYILRNHFGEIDLDPAFRVADEGELKLLKKDVLKELLEEEYKEGRREFLYFVECYASGKNDEVLEELILKLYEFSTSAPFPEDWLRSLREEEQILAEHKMLTHVRKILESLLEENDRATALCTGIGGPVFYEEALRQDRLFLQECLACETYEDYSAVIRERSFQALSRKKMPPEVEEEKKNAVKDSRNHMKKCLEGLEKQFFYLPADLIAQAEKSTAPLRKELVSLTLKFTERFEEKKKKRNIVDFSDMEHLALKILVKKEEDGSCVPTEIAKAYGEYFAEIMIDEYQDSNLVQELILTSISKKSLGGNNLFMVGDVKQSIYRFRQARPELFMEKLERYTLTESDSQRVNLSKNFRSRKEVLDTVNFLFEWMMIKEFGNIAYDEEAALYLGASMPEPEKERDVLSELLLLDLPEESEEVFDKTELEASMIAGRILEILEETKVTDKKTGELRKAVPGDIVILLRTMSGWSDTFSKVLGAYGIPSVTGSSTGYFSAMEIQTVMNFLRILDNRKQDIPLSAVLHSSIGNFSSAEMAQVRAAFPEIPYHEACIRYAAEGEEMLLREKLTAFWRMVENLRQKAEYLPIHKLLWEIYDQTSYEQLVKVLPNGAVRAANLQMLIQKALDFEQTSYRGLFNFVRYIENLQKYEVDYGVAETDAGEENAVRIMSIHKSKGLEFPIVFVSGLSKKFNKQDARERIALHPGMGLGIDSIDPEKRRKMPTLHKKMIQKQVELESLGEELRVLYVALTRAKEKLIMTGTMKKAAEEIEKNARERKLCGRGQYESLCSGSSFLEWILQASAGEETPFMWKFVTPESLVEKKVEQVVETGCDYSALRREKGKIPEDFKERVTFSYPYQKEQGIPGKVSVSELKRAAGEEENDTETEELFAEPEIVPYIPKFLREERKQSGAERGTAYHRVVECMNLSEIRHSNQVKEQIQKLVQEGKLTASAAETVNAYEIYRFCQSSLCRRMLEAEKDGRLYREQPFVMAKPAREVSDDYDSDQELLVQGIMDVYFEEDGAYVLADYKTDYVKTKEELLKRYEKQLEVYSQALEQMTGKKVKERILYSFCLGEEVFV